MAEFKVTGTHGEMYFNGEIFLAEIGHSSSFATRATFGLAGSGQLDSMSRANMGSYSMPISQISAVKIGKQPIWGSLISVSFTSGKGVYLRFKDSDRKKFDEFVNELQRAINSRPQKVELSEPGDAETKICPDCAESVKVAARKCRFCSYIFE